MLVLTRHPEEKLVFEVPPSPVPRVIEVTIVAVRGDKVRLGCDADKDILVHRKEIYDQILIDRSEAPPSV